MSDLDPKLAEILNTPGDNQVDLLAQRLLWAKETEEAARKARLEIEEEILAALGHQDEGATNFKGDEFAITTTGKVSRTIDSDAMDAVFKELGNNDLFVKIFTLKPALDLKFYRALKDANPDAYAIASKAVTAKPGKPSVSVKPIPKHDEATT